MGPICRRRHRLVGCYVILSNSGHLRSMRPPPSLFFDGCNFGAKNKGANAGEPNPRRRTPALLGSWGAMAPRFGSMADAAMESEGRGCTGEISNKKIFSNPFFSHCNLIDMVCRMNIHQGRFWKKIFFHVWNVCFRVFFFLLAKMGFWRVFMLFWQLVGPLNPL